MIRVVALNLTTFVAAPSETVQNRQHETDAFDRNDEQFRHDGLDRSPGNIFSHDFDGFDARPVSADGSASPKRLYCTRSGNLFCES